MDIKSAFRSRTFTVILASLAVIVVALLIFRLGMLVGYRKATFSARWGENYYLNFGGPPGGLMLDPMRGMPNPHGVFGKIIKIKLPTIAIQSPDNIENIVSIGEKTPILFFRANIKKEDLKINDAIVVIGEPNDRGQTEARFIRVIPPLPENK